MKRIWPFLKSPRQISALGGSRPSDVVFNTTLLALMVNIAASAI